jgi:SAM-dependent methyltransferase
LFIERENLVKLIDMLNRAQPPVPWDEGYTIPWNDPGFSERMLAFHLSQETDAASRRTEKVEKGVAWIHERFLEGRPTRILDLGCGPGLYAVRFARLGHECRGIDFGPASVAYAREQSEKEGLECAFVEEDLRTADFGSGFGLAMLIFGEFNVFTPEDARKILRKAFAALDEGGVLVLEPHYLAALRDERGGSVSSWYTATEGLFMDGPHLCLEENFWHEESKAATTRFFIVDAQTGEVQRHAASYQAYTDEEYRTVVEECGFEEVEFFPSLTGEEDEQQEEFFVLVARKPAGG